ncbi:MAG: hypothetical protein HY067_09620 [Betaproteobacteria bacterium]|nr:hypothetical protein [Betaproteobacteria bacterium]
MSTQRNTRDRCRSLQITAKTLVADPQSAHLDNIAGVTLGLARGLIETHLAQRALNELAAILQGDA